MLLTADAAYTRRTIDEDLVPIFVFGGADDYRESLGRIRDFARGNPDAVVIPRPRRALWPQLDVHLR